MFVPKAPLNIEQLLSAVKNDQFDEIEKTLNLYGLPRSGSETTDYLLLQTAIEKNHREIAKLLVDGGCRVNPTPTDRGLTPLALAFMHEDQQIALMLLQRKTTIYVANNTRTSVLHLAAEIKSLKMLRFIFVAITNINANLVDGIGKTALQILLESHANPKSVTRNEETNKIEMIRFLLSKGASIDFKSSNGRTALHHVASLRHGDITKIVLQKFDNVNLIDRYGKTALHILLSSNRESEDKIFGIVKLFLEKGAKINIADSKRKVTVGHIAAEKKYTKILNMFLQNQCNVKLQDSNANTILHKLLENSVHLRVQKMFKQTVDSILSTASLENTKNVFEKTPLHLAADNHHYDILERMLPKLENVNATDKYGQTLLHILLRKLPNPNYDIVKRLINIGANVDLKDAHEDTPVDLALKIKNEYLLQMISHSKNLSQHSSQQSKSSLHNPSDIQVISQSEKMEMTEIVEVCIATVANIEPVNNPSRTLFPAAVNQGKSVEKVLIKHSANVDMSKSPFIEDLISKPTLSSVDLEMTNVISKGADFTFGSLLSFLKHIDSQEANLMTRLLDNCKNVNATDASGNTVLHVILNSNIITRNISELKIVKIISFLHNKRYSVNAKNKAGVTALHLAAKNKHILVSQFLLKIGANINLLDHVGNSVLHYVGMLNMKVDIRVEGKLVGLFVTKGCNVDARNKLEFTPLLTAAKSGCINIIKALVSHGASDIAGENIRNLLHTAVEQGYHTAFVDYLLECGADVYNKRKDGNTAVHIAAALGRLETLMVLLKKNVEPDVRDYEGRTALHWACLHEKLDVAILLLSMGADINAADNLKVTPLMLSQNSSDALWTTLQRHVKRLEIAGMSVSLQNTNCIDDNINREDTRKLESAAQLEVLKMQHTLINTITPLADILKMKFDKLDELGIFHNKSAFRKFLLAEDFDEEFPCYYYIIKSCFLKGAIRIKLMRKARKAFSQLLSQFLLPEVCTEMILKFINNESLINLAQAV